MHPIPVVHDVTQTSEESEEYMQTECRTDIFHYF